MQTQIQNTYKKSKTTLKFKKTPIDGTTTMKTKQNGKDCR